MVTITQMQQMLDEIAAEFPPVFFDELNGGIVLLPNTMQHEKSQHNDLYVLGQYHRGGPMGRYIAIYYGSFRRVHGHLSPEELKEELRHVVRHEFRHHMESLAGAADLELEDEHDIDAYLSGENEPEKP